jgi:acylphosphatase
MSQDWTQWTVSGRVQGVGFRWFVLRRAGELGLSGWAENLPDGRVRVVARGNAGAIEQLDAALRRGPRLASVAHVERNTYQHEVDDIKTFEIR